MGDTLVRCRTAEPGVTLDYVVLASGRRSSIGIDLESGALIRSVEPHARPLLKPFSVVRSKTAALTVDRPEQPELVQFASEPKPIGFLTVRRAERLVRPLLHPVGGPLLGFYGPSIPWWEQENARPSVAIVDVGRSIRAHLSSKGLRATFMWNKQVHDLPLEDIRLLARLDWVPQRENSAIPLAEMLGFRPERLVVVITHPRQGYCPKVVAGLLPGS
jgi:hypothetical protein